MNRELKRVSIAVLLMFVTLLCSTTVIGVFQVDSLRNDPRNVRTIYDSYSAERGPILVDGQPIAKSEPSKDKFNFQRVYPKPDLYSAVTGYFTLNQGSTGIEGALNDYLSGTDNDQFLDKMNAILTGKNPQGAAVATTINPAAQQAAWDALGTNTGAVVALNPKTGAILAMVSKPSYDPNLLAGHDTNTVIANYKKLLGDSASPLINRTIAGDLYHPGSVFKLIVASAAIDSGKYTPDSEFPNPPTLKLPGSNTSITNAEGGTCGGTPTVTIATALRLSCNIPFAQLGAALGSDLIGKYAKAYGFGEKLSVPMAVTPSTYPSNTDQAKLMLSAFGQDEDRVTPLQIAMVTAAIANGGTLMKPTLINSITAPNLTTVQDFQQEQLGQPISNQSSATLTQLMVANVNNGAASNARINGVDVAGKTGTAQNGAGRKYTLWFTGFAPAIDPQIAVAVVVENGTSFGNAVAAPIARKVIEAVLNK
ncbi:MAG TPA: penicillin-binding transpeptidase domain-containing protein [Lacisediminihabitans sp.]|nr:penicillin-binding transpeptidase domain-containing protein [Lacisediminihabitans sp.]HXD62411.1 penicillin-binding transpeptidase domain-containing protein [Lacisediminihabitans sp.]